MVLEFKTSNKNTYGRRKYLLIDTEAKRFTRECASMVVTGVEIRTADYNELVKTCEREGFTEYIKL